MAIAYNLRKKKKNKDKEPAKMADGGMPDKKQQAQDSMRKAFGYQEKPLEPQSDDRQEKATASNSEVLKRTHFAEGGCPSCGYAEGGQITDNYQSSNYGQNQTHPDLRDHEKESGFVSHQGNNVKANSAASNETNKKLGQKPVDMHSETSQLEQDLVDRIMHKVSQNFSGLDRYSQGGKVANNTGTGEEADKLPNQYDDLVLRDDLESHYGDDNNSGDASGNAQEDEDRKDIVSRIMASHRKKDKNPRPA